MLRDLIGTMLEDTLCFDEIFQAIVFLKLLSNWKDEKRIFKVNKKGKITWEESSLLVVIANRYPKWIRNEF